VPYERVIEPPSIPDAFADDDSASADADTEIAPPRSDAYRVIQFQRKHS
jgi:hypothetical protein